MLYGNPEFVIFKKVHFTNCAIQNSKSYTLVFLTRQHHEQLVATNTARAASAPFDSELFPVFCLQELKLVLPTISMQLSLLTLEFLTTHSMEKEFL